MTHELETLSDDERLAREAIRDLPVPVATPAYRAALKRAFVSGHLTAPPRAASRPGWFAWPRGWPGWAALAGSAALLLIVIQGANRGPRWQVTSIAGQGVAIVDGLPVPMNHLDEMRKRVGAGARLRVPPGCQVELMSPGHMIVEVMGGTDATVPGVPGRWFWRTVEGEVNAGELRITTGSAFHGARLAIATPSAQIEVTGTTLAVICEPEGTCVCVFDGVVRVGPKAGAMESVEHGKRRYVFNDGRDPESASIRDAELEPLGELKDRRGEMMEGREAK
jgi:ferric-dicitrate binding protein FerR (iron transport regulator)